MRRQKLLTLAGLLTCSAVLVAQTAERNQAIPGGTANTVKLNGQVNDTTGGVMVGANVQVSTVSPARVIGTTKTDEMGEFAIDVAPGQYLLKITVPDFKDISHEALLVCA